MPPRKQFSREDVVNAAFNLAGEHGLSALSARRVATAIHSSTMPVYQQFESMDELKREVLRRARDLLVEYTSRHFTVEAFLNMGTGFVVFARENCNLYRALFLESHRFHDVLEELFETLYDAMSSEPLFESLPDEKRRALMHKMWIFSHGLASIICVGLLEDDSDENIIRILGEVGRAVIVDELRGDFAETFCLPDVILRGQRPGEEPEQNKSRSNDRDGENGRNDDS